MTPAQAILLLLTHREPQQTICPSEAARLLAGEGDWRARMDDVHRAARRLAEENNIAISWKGEAREVSDGPYRIGQPI